MEIMAGQKLQDTVQRLIVLRSFSCSCMLYKVSWVLRSIRIKRAAQTVTKEEKGDEEGAGNWKTTK